MTSQLTFEIDAIAHAQLISSRKAKDSAKGVTNKSSFEDCWTEERVQSVAQFWSMSEEKLQKFRELQTRLADIDHFKNCPEEVARFFMSPKGKMKAEKMFRKMIAWRKEHNVDTILEEYSPPQLLQQYFPVGVMQGLDKDGDPIFVDRCGAVSQTSLMKRFGRDELYKFGIWFREKMFAGEWQKDYHHKMGRPVRSFTVIFDLQGLSSKQLNSATLEMFKLNLQMTDKYYVLPLKRVIALRAPIIFQAFWSMIKPVIPKEEKEKIIVTSCSSEEYLKVLEQYIDLSVLPNCICSEGTGEVILDLHGIEFHGGELPPPSATDLFRGTKKLLHSSSILTASTEAMGCSSTEIWNDESSISNGVGVDDYRRRRSSVRVARLTSGYLEKKEDSGERLATTVIVN